MWISISLVLIQVFVNVQLVYWSKRFFDALQNIDKNAFIKELSFFAIIAFSAISLAMIRIFTMERYLLSWREWMTGKYINKWLSNYSFYGLKLLKKEVDNPDQRISRDVDEFTQISIILFLDGLKNFVSIVTFIAILWNLSYVFSIKLFGQDIKIYGSFVWAALIYSVIGTYLTKYIGKPLAALLFATEKKEATFRFSLIRVRENAEPISFYKAIGFEEIFLLKSFSHIVKNIKQIINRRIQITCLITFYEQLAIILPYVLTFTLFFAKKITLGGIMQIARSFGQLHDSSSWFISSYEQLALLRAAVGRLEQFSESLDLWTMHFNKKEIKIKQHGKTFKVEELKLELPHGQTLFEIDKINIKGKSYLIEGKSGIGKTTLFKALSGLWVSGKGKITLPHNKKIMFISQKNYMPIGALKFCFSYPLPDLKEEKKLKDLMKTVGLNQLIEKLNDEEEWGHILSLGEQQKVAILRAILTQPDIIFLDEATSAMDSKSKEVVYDLLKTKLKKAQIISIGHEKYLRKFHEEIISIKDEKVEIKKAKAVSS